MMKNSSGFRRYLSVGPQDPDNFSVAQGGPLFQIYLRTHLSGSGLELLHRRVVAITLFAWLPLLIFSALSGHAWGNAVRVPFLLDIEMQARFLLALPLLILAEPVVYRLMPPAVRQFLHRGLIPDSSRARFDAAITSALRLRNSVMAEVLIIVFVYLVGVLYIWADIGELHVTTWHGAPVSAGGQLTLAGLWFVLVSLPLVQFITLRWYFRIFIWIRFVWQVSWCGIRLVPSHPDRAGGIGFLNDTALAFAPFLAAHGAMLSGLIANRIFFEGAMLLDFMIDLITIVTALLLLVFFPLFMFTPQLVRSKIVGRREYGALAQRYVREFDTKWVRGGAPDDEALIGSPDIQSLADMGNSFRVVEDMRMVPFRTRVALYLAIVTLLPVAPLILTMSSLSEILKRMAGVVFGGT